MNLVKSEKGVLSSERFVFEHLKFIVVLSFLEETFGHGKPCTITINENDLYFIFLYIILVLSTVNRA